MKSRATAMFLALLIAFSAFGAITAQAQTDVTVQASTLTLGYMNVFNLPAPDGDGAFQWGSGWGIPDLVATFAGDDVTLSPNTIGDPDPYWYIGGGGPGAPGNKIMEANLYGEDVGGALAGQTVSFSGIVLANSFTSAHTVKAFVKDYAGDFSSYVESSVTLSATGLFSVSLATINDPARHIQWGLQTVGVNVWVTDTAPFGSMTIGPNPAVGNETMTFGSVKELYR